MTKSVTLKIEEDVYKTFLAHAKAEKRPLPNFIKFAALQYAQESEFVEEEEMENISKNQKLVRQLRKGIQDAQKGRGRFVD